MALPRPPNSWHGAKGESPSRRAQGEPASTTTIQMFTMTASKKLSTCQPPLLEELQYEVMHPSGELGTWTTSRKRKEDICGCLPAVAGVCGPFGCQPRRSWVRNTPLSAWFRITYVLSPLGATGAQLGMFSLLGGEVRTREWFEPIPAGRPSCPSIAAGCVSLFMESNDRLKAENRRNPTSSHKGVLNGG